MELFLRGLIDMGKWDNSKKDKQNEAIAKKVLKINNFIMNNPNRFLRIFFAIFMWPSKIVNSNSRYSKFIQKHIVILNPRQYAAAMITVILVMIFVLPEITDNVFERAALYVFLWFFVMFLGMSFPGKGGGRKDKPDPPGDYSGYKTSEDFKKNEILVP